MFSTTLRKAIALVVGGILCATGIAATATPLIEAQSAPTLGSLVSSVPMAFGTYADQMAYQGDEDTDGWDCRINGNAECGERGMVVQYDLYCDVRYAQADDMCTLEGTRIR